MLETTDTTNSNDDLPRPPAGRRAASRPAGPPKAAPAPTTPAPVAAEPAQSAPADPAPDPAAVTSAPATDAPANEAEAPARAPRKRAARKTTTRRARGAAAQEAADVTAAQAPVDAGHETTQADVPTPPVETAAPATEAAPAKAPRRRTRKTAAPAELPAAQADMAQAVAEGDVTRAGTGLEVELSATAENPEAVLAAEPAATDPDAQAETAQAVAEADEEEAADDFDTEIARRLSPSLANPFSPPVVRSPQETEDALATLASAIAADGDAAEGSDSDESEDENEDVEDRDDSPRPRRRRRGGRRRRRSGDRDNSADDSDSDDDSEAKASDAAGNDDKSHDGADSDDSDSDNDGDQDNDNDAAGDGTRRRRRRRRRRGESTDGDDDPNVEVVSRVREPRRSHGSDEVTGIEGSTRMEAKRQRRREGRSAGRRRAPILSEAEFLSRRESVKRTMAIRQKDDYTQIAVLEDNVLVEHYVDRKSSTSLIGNIYLGRVQNVLPSMEAAFIDIGRGRNAVLYAGEVDWDSYGATGGQRKMEAVFKSGQSVLVQVTKDPVGAKGARLTNHISLPGRYIVFSPGGELSGISRKLPDTERARLKKLLDELIPSSASVIVRTAAEGVDSEDLVRDVNRLTAQWEAIEKKSKQGQAPQLLYSEPDATVRIVRDLFTEDFGELVVDGNGGPEDAYDMIEAYVTHVAPHLQSRLQHWNRTESGDLFAKYRIDEQIAKALERKVFLPSGGSLIIDRTEAMTVIDVNTGKFTGTGGNLEATVTSNNLEAAEEIVRQLRLRDIGGIIVVDFIDMVLPSNRELLLRRLVECLGRDRTRHQVAEVTSLGLVQMTRKKIGTGLAEAFTETCDECKGRGYIRSEEPVESQAPADGGERRANKGRPQRNRGGRKNKGDGQDKAKSGKGSESGGDAASAGSSEQSSAGE